MEQSQAIHEEWECLKRFFPPGWEDQARHLGAWRRRPRSIPSTEALLRILLIHLSDGCSLRETAVRAREGGLANISNVALTKRLSAAGEWLRWMATGFLERQGVSTAPPPWLKDYKVRAVDATVVSEPGSTGTDWRVHYSLQLFGLKCDEFHLTGPKVGETYSRFSVAPGDLMMGDRAYGRPKGFRHVLDSGGHFLSRLKSKPFRLLSSNRREHKLNDLLAPLAVNETGEWSFNIHDDGQRDVPVRICALRMSESAAERATLKATREQRKKQDSLDGDTLALQKYVVVASSLPETISARQILELYRTRWQIELAFKRMKSIMGFGHLPKESEDSAAAWLHGKLLVAFLAQALMDEGCRFSPWGYPT